MKNPIVIIGAGFGGLATALELAKRRTGPGDREIFLIDRSEFHLYTPLIYEIDKERIPPLFIAYFTLEP